MVAALQEAFVKGREIVGDRNRVLRERRPDQTIAVIRAARVYVERAVADAKVDIAVGVSRGSVGALPDTALAAVGSAVERCDAPQASRLVNQQPPMVQTSVAVRRECDVKDAVVEKQARALVCAQGVEGNLAVFIGSVAGAAHARRDQPRTPELLLSGRDVERMKMLLDDSGAGDPFRRDVERSGRWVDDRRARDTNFGVDVSVADEGGGNRANALPGIDETRVPKRRGARPVRVEGVNAVMLGSDVNDIVNAALMREGDLRSVERLRVDVAVDRV